MQAIRTMLGVSVVALCLAAAVLADEVVTKSGTHITGQVTMCGDNVAIKTENGTLTLPAWRVSRVISAAGSTEMRADAGVPRTMPVLAAGGGVDRAKDGAVVLQAALDRRISVRFDDTPLADVVTYLREITGINFVYNTGELQAANVMVTLNLDNVTVRQVLDLILADSSLSWTLASGGVVRFGPRESIERYVVRTYDVRDLLLNVEDKRAQRVMTLTETGNQEGQSDESGLGSQWNSGGGGFGLDSSTTDNGQQGLGSPSQSLSARTFDLATLITSTVRPETWAQPAVVQCGGDTTAPGDTQPEDTIW